MSLPDPLQRTLKGCNLPDVPLIRKKLKDLFSQVSQPGELARRIQQDPYILLWTLNVKKKPNATDTNKRPWDIKLVDTLARVIGLPSETRAGHIAKCFISKQCKSSGHSLLSIEQLQQDASGLASVGPDITLAAKWRALQCVTEDGLVTMPDPQHIALKSIALMEELVYRTFVCDIRRQSLPMVQQLLASYGGGLTQEQTACVRNAFEYSASLVYGPGGSGKTRCCDAIAYVAKNLDIPIHFCAHAWLAAEKVNRSVECMEVSATSILSFVYRNLGQKGHDVEDLEGLWDGVPDEEAQLALNGILVVDEASMVDTRTLAMLICILQAKKWRLVLVGDDNQLPPIGMGQPFADLLKHPDSGVVITRLTRTFRTSEPHLLTLWNILRGQKCMLPKFMATGECEYTDLVYNANKSTHGIIKNILDLYQGMKERGRQDELQIISAGKVYGPLSSNRLNVLIAEKIRPPGTHTHQQPLVNGLRVMYVGPNKVNPHPSCMGTVVHNESGDGWRVCWDIVGICHDVGKDMPLKDLAVALVVGEKVVCMKNLCANKEEHATRNGEVGKVIEIGHKHVTVKYASGKERVHRTPEELAALELGYCLTTHKTQGQQYSQCVVVLHSSMASPGKLFSKNMLYTAVTRPSERLILLCDKEAILHRCSKHVIRRTVLNLLMDGKLSVGSLKASYMAMATAWASGRY